MKCNRKIRVCIWEYRDSNHSTDMRLYNRNNFKNGKHYLYKNSLPIEQKCKWTRCVRKREKEITIEVWYESNEEKITRYKGCRKTIEALMFICGMILNPLGKQPIKSEENCSHFSLFLSFLYFLSSSIHFFFQMSKMLYAQPSYIVDRTTYIHRISNIKWWNVRIEWMMIWLT